MGRHSIEMPPSRMGMKSPSILQFREVVLGSVLETLRGLLDLSSELYEILKEIVAKDPKTCRRPCRGLAH